MNNQEIINAINKLSLKIEQLTSTLNYSGNFWDKYSVGIIGLSGVLVGAFITYFFNKKINQEERTVRFATQRKNLIYAPIYKELLQLTQYINKHSKTYYINIITEDYDDDWEEEYYYNGNRHKNGRFIIWDEMKNDIRKNYIPQKIQEFLEEINKNLKIYRKNRDRIDKDFKNIYKKYKIDELYKEADRKEHNLEKGDTILALSTPSFLFLKDSNYKNGLREIYKNHGSFSKDEYIDFKNKLEELFKNLTVEINRNDFFESYHKLVKSIIKSKKEIDKLIKYVVDKHEFGEKLEKYE